MVSFPKLTSGNRDSANELERARTAGYSIATEEQLRYYVPTMRLAPAKLILSLVSVLARSTPAFASDLPLELSQYSHTAWTIQGGGLKGSVRAITQTPDGYLWLGTEFGLIRFDGVRLVPWSPPPGDQLPSTNVRSLLAGRDGTLWIGTLEGLASWKDGKLKRYAAVGKHNVLALLEDSQGTVWAGTFGVPHATLCAIRDAEVQCSGDDGSLGEFVWSLYEDRDGRLWAGTETGLWRWNPGPPKRYPMDRPISTSQAIVQLTPHAGPLAVSEGIWQLDAEKMKEYPLSTAPGLLTTPVGLFVDHDGDLWVGTLQRGLLRVSRGRTSVFARSDGLSGDRVMTMFQDREGNMWVGTADGVDRFRAPTVIQFSTRQGLSSPSVWSVLPSRDNSVWVSTVDGLNRLDAGHVTIYRSGTRESIRMRGVQGVRATPAATWDLSVTEKTDSNLPDDRVGSLYEDDRGRIWVSSPSGIARFDRGRFTHVTELPGGSVNAIVGDGKGGIWISYEDRGLVHWDNGKVVETLAWSSIGGNVVAASVLADPARGGLWLGFFEGGLTFLKDGQVRAHYGTSDGLGAGRVMGLELDREGVLWAATEGGLSRLKDGRIITVTRANGLPCDTVHWETRIEDFYWLYAACGLLQVPRTELENWSEDPKRTVHFKVFDSTDGVRNRALLTGYTPRVGKSADGKLWFTHLNSVSVLDPRILHENKLPVPVHIEQVTADARFCELKDGMRLPSRVHNLAIDYTAPSLVAPEKVRFRVKLEGEDKDWRELLNIRHVEYTDLPPKRYRFRVLACNNSGVWNEEGASLEFIIPPAWYQTYWFLAACIALFLTLIWGLHRLRVRQLEHEFNIGLEQRVAERTRIARDLHDTLLQSFQALLPRLQASINMFASRPDDARRNLEQAADQASQAIAEGRDAIQGMRMSTVEKNDLVVAIRALGDELASAATNQPSPKFTVVVEGTSRNLHPILRDEVYRLATEALRNAFRHAQAQNVEAEIHYDQKYFRLRVRDDGKGIPSDVLSGDGHQGHYGLRGMRERAQLVGGKLMIWTEVGGGTEIELNIPGAKAYVKSARPFWYFGKRSAAEAEDKERIERE